MVIGQIFEGICGHSPDFWRDLLSFAEFLNGFAVIRRTFEAICDHTPTGLLSFAEFLKRFAVIRRIFEGICYFRRTLEGNYYHSPICWRDLQSFAEFWRDLLKPFRGGFYGKVDSSKQNRNGHIYIYIYIYMYNYIYICSYLHKYTNWKNGQHQICMYIDTYIYI